MAGVARELGLRAPVALSVNPDVDAHTHAKITTGRKASKFGIPLDQIPALYANAPPEVQMAGLAVHIGSQILDLEPFRQAWGVMADRARHLRAAGLKVDRLDLGGGLGIGSDDAAGADLAEYAATIAETAGGLDLALNVEPGRWLCVRAGVLVTEVLYSKAGEKADIVIVDATMNDLMRPALYDALHPVLTLHSPRSDADARPSRLVGPICESSDEFGLYGDLGRLQRGDLLTFADAGAYGAAMSSTYNSRDLIPEVLVDEGQFKIILRRAHIHDLLKLEQGVAWQRAE